MSILQKDVKVGLPGNRGIDLVKKLGFTFQISPGRHDLTLKIKTVLTARYRKTF